MPEGCKGYRSHRARTALRYTQKSPPDPAQPDCNLSKRGRDWTWDAAPTTPMGSPTLHSPLYQMTVFLILPHPKAAKGTVGRNTTQKNGICHSFTHSRSLGLAEGFMSSVYETVEATVGMNCCSLHSVYLGILPLSSGESQSSR